LADRHENTIAVRRWRIGFTPCRLAFVGRSSKPHAFRQKVRRDDTRPHVSVIVYRPGDSVYRYQCDSRLVSWSLLSLSMRILIPFFAACVFELSSAALAQPVSLGVIGGSSLTQDFQNRSFGNPVLATYHSTPLRWIAGGIVEVRLPKHLAVEVDGLYHDLAFTIEGFGSGLELLHVVTWEVPVLAKYRVSLPRFSPSMVKPFIEAGPTFRAAYNLNGALPSSHGFAAGAGAEVHAWKLRIAPQVRYVRWARDGSHIIPRTVPDQAQLLVGISF
jgi:hypothetical protein